jgi:hypothetical protein
VDHDTLIQRWWYFFEGSIGCIGILKQWLVRSLYRALREESPELTRAHLEQSVLPDAKWERMRADARSGEAEFQYADGQNSYLSELANMPTFTSKQPDPAPPSTPPTADQKTRKPKGHIGEPSPYRDQVGTVQQEGEATHCSYSRAVISYCQRASAVIWIRLPQVSFTMAMVEPVTLVGGMVNSAPAAFMRSYSRWTSST